MASCVFGGGRDACPLPGKRLFSVGSDVVLDVIRYFAAASEEVNVEGFQMEAVLLYPVSERDVGCLAFLPSLFIELDRDVFLRMVHRRASLRTQCHPFLEVVAVAVVALEPCVQVLVLLSRHLAYASYVYIRAVGFGQFDFATLVRSLTVAGSYPCRRIMYWKVSSARALHDKSKETMMDKKRISFFVCS